MCPKKKTITFGFPEFFVSSSSSLNFLPFPGSVVGNKIGILQHRDRERATGKQMADELTQTSQLLSRNYNFSNIHVIKNTLCFEGVFKTRNEQQQYKLVFQFILHHQIYNNFTLFFQIFNISNNEILFDLNILNDIIQFRQCHLLNNHPVNCQCNKEISVSNNNDISISNTSFEIHNCRGLLNLPQILQLISVF